MERGYVSLIYADIIHFLRSDNAKHSSQNLFKGTWGALLFMFYYEKYIDESEDNATQYLLDLYQDLDASFDHNYTFCTGLCGPFWVLYHLTKHDFVELDIGHIFSDFISGAIWQSRNFIEEKNYDFLHGSAGICNLLVEFTARDDVKKHLALFVDNLLQSAVKLNNGYSLPLFYYHTEPASKPGVDAFSLAHGTCALQIILLKIHRAGIEQRKCEELITKSMDFILSHMREDRDSNASLFPAYLDGKSIYSRVSWCYGDTNVAVALWQCGNYFGNELWKQASIEILKYNALRLNPGSSGVMDACLCHGSSGNAALYMRMWHETKEPLFLKCAEDWYKVAETMLHFSGDINIPGVKVWQGKGKEWQYCWDLLDGSAGMGLAFMSREMNDPLAWDEFLLLS